MLNKVGFSLFGLIRHLHAHTTLLISEDNVKQVSLCGCKILCQSLRDKRISMILLELYFLSEYKSKGFDVVIIFLAIWNLSPKKTHKIASHQNNPTLMW